MNRGRLACEAGEPTPNSIPGEEERMGAGMTRAVVDTVGGWIYHLGSPGVRPWRSGRGG